MKYQIYLNKKTSEIVNILADTLKIKPCRVLKDLIEPAIESYANSLITEIKKTNTKGVNNGKQNKR